ncbi:MAG: Response regulator receiver protein [Parcubacteria group bacterium GW2011_GWB1_57_6]|nr:MAG: Response regulator receiver protein [Parcubacteria group bacterium GW2011_GWA1_56_13]KKW45815.1 MAG: Response regulator receiver protein [Parcubacteria group bacterium GW2011_GWB1_57_6]
MSGILATQLISKQFQVISMNDGTKAFERIKAEQPDIVLLDIILPGVSGFDILDQLKRDESTRAIPVLVLSNLGSREDIQRGISLGAEGYLVKANNMVEDIVKKVGAILDKPH